MTFIFKQKKLILPALLIFPGLTGWFFHHTIFQARSFLYIHTSLELLTSSLAFMIAGYELSGHIQLKNNRIGNPGIPMLGFGLVSLFHVFSYPGMDPSIFETSREHAIFFWFAGRILLGVSFLLILHPVKINSGRIIHRYTFFPVLLYLLLIAWIGFTQLDSFFFLPGTRKSFLDLKLGAGIFSIFLFSVLAFYPGRKKDPLDLSEGRLLWNALLFFIAADSFYIFYRHAYDFINLIAHTYNILGFLFLYRATVETSIESSLRRLKEVESREQATEHLFRVTFEQAAVGIAHVSREGQWLKVNKKLCEITGYREDELLNLNFREITHSEDLESDLELHQKLLRGELTTGSLVKRYIRKNGESIWVQLTVALVESSDDGIPFFISVIEDIDQTHRASRELHLTQERYRQLFTRLSSGLAIHEILCDENGKPDDYRFLEVNPAFEQITGLKGSEITGKKVSEILPFLEDRWIQRYGEAALSGKHFTFEDYNRDLNRYFEVSVYSPAQGQFATIFQDITKRKENENKILQLTRLYRTLSLSNEAVLRCENEVDLFDRICNYIVDITGMNLAWIVLLDGEGKAKAVAAAGESLTVLEDLLKSDPPRFQDKDEDLKIREPDPGAPVWLTDFNWVTMENPWILHATDRDIKSGGILPLKSRDRILGSLIIYSGDPDAFNEETRNLFVELADNLSFALNVFEQDEERVHTLQTLTRLTQAVEQTPSSIVITDIDANIEYANRSFYETTGYTPGEVKGKNPRILQSGNTPKIFYEELWRNLTAGKNWEGEFINRKKDGSEYTESVIISPVREGDGKISGYLAIKEDITRKKENERLFIESEQRFRALVEQSLTGNYMIQNSKLVYVNPRFAEILGYENPDELIGNNLFSLVIPEDRDMVANEMQKRYLGQDVSSNYSARMVHRDGHIVYTGIHGAITTFNGEPAIIGLMQDITDKHRAEEQIQHYLNKLETTLMQTVEVATTISEMRDPYTAGHERRVAEIAVAIGEELGLESNRLEGLHVAGFLHDIGKITIPIEILAKPGKLTEMEFTLIKTHASASYDVLKKVEFPWPVADVAYQHHERIDGSGYPRGLHGDQILLESRIMAVADVVEAMASHRPYRPSMGLDRALLEIERGMGSIYDCEVARICLHIFREKGFQLPEVS